MLPPGFPRRSLTIVSGSRARQKGAMPIHYERDDEHVVRITIDRPDARNSADMEHFKQLRMAWERFDEDPEAWVAIIAAVNGFCTAGGMEMLGGVDIRVACPEAQFSVMEPKRGLFAGGGTTVRLPRQIPFPQAMEFLLCADLIPAQRAYEMGFLNAIVPRDELLDKAYEYAHRITANAPLAVQATKQSVWEGLGMSLRDAYKNESALSSMIFQTEDAKEGPQAFREKRRPNWQGK